MIQLARSVLAVIVGYMIFALSAFAIFQVSGQRAHADASAPFMMLSTVAGVMFAIAGGYVAALLAARKPFVHGVAVALVLALGAAVSLASTIGHGAIWSQVTALALMAPAAAIGGWVRSRGGNAHSPLR